MNTNSNIYTVIYTTIIVVVVAAVLAFVAMTLKPQQDANIKAGTINQMLAAAQYASMSELSALDNRAVLQKYSDNVKNAILIDASGAKIGELSTEVSSIELADNLKDQNTNMKNGAAISLPVYIFDKDGADVYVIPIYGAGLWGPIWGYVAINADCTQIIGASFDHSSETPGLGAKIKDEPWFAEQFIGKCPDFQAEKPFAIVKGGVPEGTNNAVDAISGATMTCNGLDAAINTWFAAYAPFFKNIAGGAESACCEQKEECNGQCNGSCAMECQKNCEEKCDECKAEEK